MKRGSVWIAHAHSHAVIRVAIRLPDPDSWPSRVPCIICKKWTFRGLDLSSKNDTRGPSDPETSIFLLNKLILRLFNMRFHMVLLAKRSDISSVACCRHCFLPRTDFSSHWQGMCTTFEYPFRDGTDTRIHSIMCSSQRCVLLRAHVICTKVLPCQTDD